MSQPLAIDIFCGLGGWTQGLLAEGFYVVGFDLERHVYGEHHYPAQLVLQDVRTLHGSQFKDAALIVASPPCQEYSYIAMPWSRAKQIAVEYRNGIRDVRKLTELFDACFRIQREACEAAGQHIPMVVENVRGAIPWVGRSRWNYGSFHLWGDVPALMPMTQRMSKSESVKVAGLNWSGHDKPGYVAQAFNTTAEQRLRDDIKTVGHANRDGYSHTRHLTNQAESDGIKQPGISGTRNNGKGNAWFQDGAAKHGSKSSARKAASALIAKIPFELARYIAKTYKPP